MTRNQNHTMQKTLIIALGLSLFGFISCSTDQGEAEAEQVSTERDLSEKLFSKLGNVLKPSETLNLLELLDEEYKTHSDEKYIKKHETVSELLNFADLNEEKCPLFYTEYMILQRSLLAYEKSPNIVDYLKYQKDALFSQCKDFLSTKLKEDVELLPEGTEGFLELLKQSMVESDPDNEVRDSLFLIPDVPVLTRGIVSFLKKTSESLIPKALEKEDGSAFFRKEYDLSIRKPCYIVKKQIQSSITEFSTLSHEEHILEQFDPFVKLWLENFNVCMCIVGRGQTFSIGLGRESYKQLSDDENKKTPSKKQRSAWNHLTSCFGNEC